MGDERPILTCLGSKALTRERRQYQRELMRETADEKELAAPPVMRGVQTYRPQLKQADKYRKLARRLPPGHWLRDKMFTHARNITQYATPGAKEAHRKWKKWVAEQQAEIDLAVRTELAALQSQHRKREPLLYDRDTRMWYQGNQWIGS